MNGISELYFTKDMVLLDVSISSYSVGSTWIYCISGSAGRFQDPTNSL